MSVSPFPSFFCRFFEFPLWLRGIIGVALTTAFYFSQNQQNNMTAKVSLTTVYLYLLWNMSLLPPASVDSAECRRERMGGEFVNPQFHEDDVEYKHSYTTTRDGRAIFHRQWHKKGVSSYKSVILFLHGFSASSGNLCHVYGNRFAKEGFLFASYDQHGHGRSDGLYCHVKSFQRLIDDSVFFATSLRKEFPSARLFVMSESMGGAVALNLSRQTNGLVDGLILLAPMAKIADHMKPHPMVIKSLSFLGKVFPTLPIAPVPDLLHLSFKRQDVIDFLMNLSKNFRYGRKPRLGTALTFLNTTLELEENLHQITVPFLVLHGDADRVTDPNVSKSLYQRAQSKDKTLKLYPGAYHTIILGEADKTREIVFGDIFQWLEKRR